MWKNGTAPSYKMPEAKKQTLSLKKKFRSEKPNEFI